MYQIKKIIGIMHLSLIIFILGGFQQANSFWGASSKTIIAISKSAKTLPDNEIIKLSKLSNEIKGTHKVGLQLGNRNLPSEVLSDTFLRIAIHQRKLSRDEAVGMYSRLKNTPGFSATLRKVLGNSDVGTAGHLNELRIADNAAKNGFEVLGIGHRFNDGVKKSPTDIDLILKRKDKFYAIEAKDYAPTTRMPLDKFRADLNTLNIYKNNNANVIPVFMMTNIPVDSNSFELLQKESRKRGVQLLFGSPEAQITQLHILGDIF